MERKKRVRLFGLSTCPSCKRTKSFLEDKGIDYELIEVDLLESGEQWLMSKELRKYNPDATYPTLIIEEIIVGFDEDAIKAVIGIK